MLIKGTKIGSIAIRGKVWLSLIKPSNSWVNVAPEYKKAVQSSESFERITSLYKKANVELSFYDYNQILSITPCV